MTYDIKQFMMCYDIYDNFQGLKFHNLNQLTFIIIKCTQVSKTNKRCVIYIPKLLDKQQKQFQVESCPSLWPN